MNTVDLHADKIIGEVSEAVKRTFLRFGSYVRTRARSMMRPQRRKTADEMSADELRVFTIRKRIAKQKGLPRPKAPWAATPAGEPIRTRIGLVKKIMSIAFDDKTLTLVVGPDRVDTLTGLALWENEFGLHPFMRPAFQKELPGLPDLWRDAITH